MDFLRSPEATAELKLQQQNSAPKFRPNPTANEENNGEVKINELSKDYKPRALEENCGVFGVIGGRENASRVAFFGLYALNHRKYKMLNGRESSERNRPFFESFFNQGYLEDLLINIK